MVALRATKRVLRYLSKPSIDRDTPDTALGDWYVNRFVVRRRPLLLLISSKSLLPMICPARDVRTLPQRLPELVAQRLWRLRIPGVQIQAEARAMTPVHVARTLDRSVVGTMVDFIRTAPYYLGDAPPGDAVLHLVEAKLAYTPCRCSSRDTIWPEDVAKAHLAERWGSAA